MAGVGTKRDVGLRRKHPADLVNVVRHQVGHVVVVADSQQGDQVDVAGDGVDLADTGDRRDLLGDLGDLGDVGLDEHDGSDHGGSSV